MLVIQKQDLEYYICVIFELTLHKQLTTIESNSNRKTQQHILQHTQHLQRTPLVIEQYSIPVTFTTNTPCHRTMQHTCSIYNEHPLSQNNAAYMQHLQRTPLVIEQYSIHVTFTTNTPCHRTMQHTCSIYNEHPLSQNNAAYM